MSESVFLQENKKNNANMRNLILLGLVSFFVDMSTQMVSPVIPLFLMGLGAAPYIIGIIEGIADSLPSLIKPLAGYISDKIKSKKPMTIIGYACSLLYKMGLLLSSSWIGVLFSKIVDKTGKGLRTAPRDSLIAESGGKKLGRSFGFHKMFDSLGACFGVILAFLILTLSLNGDSNGFGGVILYSIIPAAIGVIILFFVKESKKTKTLNAGKIKINTNATAQAKTKLHLSKTLIVYLVIIFIFSVGTSSEAFLILKASYSGFDNRTVLLLFTAMHGASFLFSFLCGSVSDKFGKKIMLIPSYVVFPFIYFGFAFLTGTVWMFVLFVLYGLFIAMITGAEKAFLVELSPKGLKGTVLGIYGASEGIGLLLASLIAGLLMTFWSDSAPFVFGGILSGVAAVMLVFLLGVKRKNVDDTELKG